MKSDNKNHTSYSDVPKSNPHGEDEDRKRRSLVNSKSSTRWLETSSWHTFGGEEKRVDVIALNLSGWWETKTMETLTLRGIYSVPKWA